MNLADSDAPGVKPEPESPVESGGETFVSDAKADRTPPQHIVKIEIGFSELPIEFEPETDGFKGKRDDSEGREINVKVENDKMAENEPGKVSGTPRIQHTTLEARFKKEKLNCVETSSRFRSMRILKEYSDLDDREKTKGDKTCKRKLNVKPRALIDNEEKQFSCPDCANKYNTKSSLRRHAQTHVKKASFECSQCLYKCVTQKRLTNHLIKQHGQKCFSCPSCSYTCSKRANIAYHLLTHTGEKPFSCPDCEYRCTQKGNLNSHISSKHSEASCSICGCRCPNKRLLKQHKLTHT